jgi:hypothetical protein
VSSTACIFFNQAYVVLIVFSASIYIESAAIHNIKAAVSIYLFLINNIKANLSAIIGGDF